MPPPAEALLPEKVELLTVSVPPLNMPPPLESEAPLPERVELLTVTVPKVVYAAAGLGAAVGHRKVAQGELCAVNYKEYPILIVAAYCDIGATAVDGQPRPVGYGRQLC